MSRFAAFFVALFVALTPLVGRPADDAEHQSVVKMRELAKEEASRGDKKAAAFLESVNGSKDDDKARLGAEWLVGVGKRGVPEAQFVLGTMLDTRTPPEHAAALTWHQAAAKKGYVPAMARLAGMYYKGEGVAKDDAKAMEWARRAADKGDSKAQGWLGARYFEGKIVPKDLIAARDWLEKSMKQSNDPITAMLLIGVYMKTGVPGDEEKGKALAKKLGAALEVASPSKEKEDPAAKMDRLVAAAKGGDVRAQSSLGHKYLTGEGAEKDLKQAHDWLSKAAAQGDASAMANLGSMYGNGNGVPRDDTKAVELYRPAAAKGNATAQANLANYYRRGEGGLPRDEAEAVRLYKIAAEQGNRPGQRGLAMMYEQGAGGLPKDRQKAIELYRKAAAQGDATAVTRLKALEK